MRTNKRFIKSVIETATEATVEMPWARGSRRTSFANRRNAQADWAQNALAMSA